MLYVSSPSPGSVVLRRVALAELWLVAGRKSQLEVLDGSEVRLIFPCWRGLRQTKDRRHAMISSEDWVDLNDFAENSEKSSKK